MPRSQRRKSTPSSPAKSKVPNTEPHRTRGKPRTRSCELSPAVTTTRRHVRDQLGAVEEEGETIALHDPQSVRRHGSPHQRATREESRPVPRNSRVPPSVRATVHDSIAPTQPQIESIIKHLTELDFRAGEVLSQLDTYTNQEILENLDDHESSMWDDLKDLALKLETERQYYGTDGDFLKLDRLTQELATKNLPKIGAEHIFTKANLALFFYRLLEAHPIELHNLIVTLTSLQTFPEGFRGKHVLEGSTTVEYSNNFKYQTISVGLDILTQCFIFKAKRDAGRNDFDHVKILRDVFYEKEETARNVSLGMLSSIGRRGYVKSMEEIMDNIMRTVSKTEGQPVNLTALQEIYPWNGFVAEALAWIRVRIEQIDSAIQQEGGARAIKRSLHQPNVAINSRANKKSARVSRANEDFAGKISFLRNVDEELNAGETDSQAPEEERNKEADGNGADAEKTATHESIEPASSTRILQEIVSETPIVRERSRDTVQIQTHTQGQDHDQDQDQSNLIDDDEPNEQEIPDSAQSPSGLSVIRPTQETSAVLRVIQRQTKEGNKENSPPAQPARVPNQRTNTVRSVSAVPERTQPIQKGKRRRRSNDDSESDEDAFESDQRQTKRPRPRPHSGKVIEPVNRQLHTASDVFQTNADESDKQPRRRTKDNNRPGPSTQPAPTSAQVRTHARSLSTNSTRTPSSTLPPSTFHEEYLKVKKHARTNTAFATAVAPQAAIRIPQTRRAWTGSEIERLLLLMGQYGCGWAAIKKADECMVDPQLMDRNQVQLKDKARNIKIDFLKAEQPLPEQLSTVTISKTHKYMLKTMNIAYPGEEFEEE